MFRTKKLVLFGHPRRRVRGAAALPPRPGAPRPLPGAFMPLLDLYPRADDEPPFSPDADLLGVIDALDLLPSAANRLAVGWTLARGELDGLRVEAPVRMAAPAASFW